MTVYYLTKHWQTDGITEVDTLDNIPWQQIGRHYQPHTADGHVWAKRDPEDYWATRYKIGRDAFPSLDDAIADVETRRTRKIASLRKQLAHLETLNIP